LARTISLSRKTHPFIVGHRSKGSSAGILTRKSRNMSQIQDREKNFPFLRVKTSLESHTASYSTITRSSFHQCKAVSAEKRTLTSYCQGCKCVYFTVTPVLVFMEWCLVNHVAEFTFLFLLTL